MQVTAAFCQISPTVCRLLRKERQYAREEGTCLSTQHNGRPIKDMGFDIPYFVE